MTVVSGNALTGYDLLYYGAPAVDDQALTLPLPPPGTIFKQVLPTFIRARDASAPSFPGGTPGAVPPAIPGGGTLPPLPPLPSYSSGLSGDFQHGVGQLEGYNAVYAYSLGSAGAKAPNGLQITMYVAGGRTVFAIRPVGGEWVHYYLSYIVESVVKANNLPSLPNQAYASLVDDGVTARGSERLMGPDGSPSPMGVSTYDPLIALREINVSITGSLEQIEFVSRTQPTVERRQVWTFRQLAEWIF